MAVILWGKPTITVNGAGSNSGNSSNTTVPTPSAGSVQLTTNQGDEHTADLEGGGYEAKRVDKNSYTFEFSVRFAQGRTMPFEDKSLDGNVTGEYTIAVTGGDAGSPTMKMNLATVRYEDEMDADDGAKRHYYCDSLVPNGYYDAESTTPGALKVVASGASTNQIALADVTPYYGTKTLAANDYVVMVEEQITWLHPAAS